MKIHWAVRQFNFANSVVKKSKNITSFLSRSICNEAANNLFCFNFIFIDFISIPVFGSSQINVEKLVNTKCFKKIK